MSTTSSDFNYEKFREAIKRTKEKLRKSYGIFEESTDGDNKNVVRRGGVRNGVRRGSAGSFPYNSGNKRITDVHRSTNELWNNILSHKVCGGKQGEDPQERTKSAE